MPRPAVPRLARLDQWLNGEAPAPPDRVILEQIEMEAGRLGLDALDSWIATLPEDSLAALAAIVPDDSPVFETVTRPRDLLLVDFEDLDVGGYGNMPADYAGFDWNVVYKFEDLFTGEVTWHFSDNRPAIVHEAYLPGSGFEAGSVDPGERVAQAYDAGVQILQAGGEDFIFDSVYLTSGWFDDVEVTLSGYNDGVLVGTFVTTIGKDAATFVDVDWGVIDELTIVQSGATYTNLVMDNFTFFV